MGKNPEGGYDRIAYTEANRQAREYVIGLMRAAGLDTEVDAAGNISGRRAGREPGLPVLVLGSHVDSVAQGSNSSNPKNMAEMRTDFRHDRWLIMWRESLTEANNVHERGSRVAVPLRTTRS